MEQFNYPIKYAVLELKEKGGWTTGYKEITQGFIVSKCFVVESAIKYLSNGDSKIIHKVVFPFKDISLFRLVQQRGTSHDTRKTIPSYNACGNPYPVDNVSDLFDKYDEAQAIALQNNEELRRGLTLKVSVSDPNWKAKLEELEKAHDEKLNNCIQFEHFISEQTSDMEITPNERMKCRIRKL